MRAIVQRRYGPPQDVLELQEIPQPHAGPDEVLVRVRAASVHPDVWHVVNGWPRLLRLMGSGLRRPKVRVPGTDLAGTVEAVGGNVTRFRPGDDVFGEVVRGHQWKNGGAYAEYAAVLETSLEKKPVSLTFEQAAALPTSGLIALHAVRREGRVQAGEEVLINGAGGAVGTLALQLATAYEARVTAVDHGSKAEMLRQLGAHRFVDFTQEDFTATGARYDLIIDIPGNRSFDELRRVLADGGRYVLIGHDDYGRSGNRWIGGTIGRMLRVALFAPFGRPQSPKPIEGAEPLAVLARWADAGKLAPVVERAYPLGQAVDALEALTSGRVLGKLVLTV